MQPSIERLEKARLNLARTIANHDNPHAFLPIFRRLEQEIAAIRDADTYLARIMELAFAQSSS